MKVISVLFLAAFLIKLTEFRCVHAQRSTSVLFVIVDAPLLIVRFIYLARLSLEESQVKHCNSFLSLPYPCQRRFKIWLPPLFVEFMVVTGSKSWLIASLGVNGSTSYAIGGIMIEFCSLHILTVSVRFNLINWDFDKANLWMTSRLTFENNLNHLVSTQ